MQEALEQEVVPERAQQPGGRALDQMTLVQQHRFVLGQRVAVVVSPLSVLVELLEGRALQQVEVVLGEPSVHLVQPMGAASILVLQGLGAHQPIHQEVLFLLLQ